ncbi:MAG: domain containing protein [Candidatus Solibacter sp.]|nr:domain containing protein [Candidatus Solibacter sp.]
MRKLSVCLLIFAATSLAQTADIGYFRAVMLPSNEVPATPTGPTGAADLVAHVIRDSSGQIIGGTVDFLVRTNFPAAVTATGLHIHSGPAGVNAPVVINTGLSGANTLAVKAGGDIVHRPAQVAATDTAGVAALRGLFTTPDQYYVNIHTTDFPGGIMRGQLQPAIGTVLIGVMSADNEVPSSGTTANGVAVVTAIATLNSAGALTTAETFLSSTYRLGDSTTFTGFHIHPGAAGTNGPVVINSGIANGTAIDPTGAGVIGPFYTEIDITNATQVATFANLFLNPQANYINVHTNLHPGGIMRAQLRTTDTTVFPITLDSANEVGNINLKGTAPSLITVRTIRNEDGSVAAGTVFFDVNYRFPSAASFTGLHIHDAGAGVNGPISIPMVPTYDANFASDTGNGNYYNYTPGINALATLNDIVTNPENHYANIHTTLDPGGSARAQLAPIVATAPTVAAAIAANLDKTATVVAPGGLFSIFGTNLVKVKTDLSGWAGAVLPKSLNGTSVTVGGKSAALVYVSPTQINAQVPVDVAPGPQPVVVKSAVGSGTSFTVTVAATAPAIFFAPSAAVLKNVDFSLVSATNPAKAGDVILVYCTGLGLTSVNLATGTLVPTTATASTNASVTATIGGKPAAVAYAIASPGFAGLYQVALTVPAGVANNSPIVLTQGTTVSNSVPIAIQ